ncbi:MAG TPA: hypothetical protein VFF73_41735, partial [Planctomycetota bacterium]|nr:hypothetical protein [Planctomycetota bacterium]
LSVASFGMKSCGRRVCRAGIESGDGVGGLDSTDDMHLSWARGALRRGDEITVRVVESAEIDPPRKRYRVAGKRGG